MSNRNVKILIILLIAALLGFFLYQYFSNDRHKWFFIYENDVTEPYGGYVLAELLKTRGDTSNFHVIRDSLLAELPLSIDEAPSAYIYLGEHLFLDSLENQHLLEFVANGNNAWVISNEFSPLLLDTLLFYDYELDDYDEDYEDDYEYEEEEYMNIYYSNYTQVHVDTSIFLNVLDGDKYFLEEDYECKFVRDNEVHDYGWTSFIDYTNYIGEEVEFLGYINDHHLNYIKFKFGDGYFHLHSTPEVFTNFYLMDTIAFVYADHIFRDLKDSKVYWDEDNRDFEYIPGDYTGGNYRPDEGPLAFVLSQPSLKFAWYTLLGAVLLYLFLGARRKQRIIPVLAKNENTSIEYSETIGQLYTAKKNHRRICMLKMDLFLSFLRERYRVNTAIGHPDDEDKLIRRISIKSNIDSKSVRAIFYTWDRIRNADEVDEHLLIRFHRMLEHFYRNCK